jgi:hypothetical protein
VARSDDGPGNHPDPDGLPGRPEESAEDDSIVGYRPRLDYTELGVETVVFRISVSGTAATVADGLHGPPFTDVYEVAGPSDIVAIGRFRGRDALAATLAGLASNPSVGAVDADVALVTACEYDTAALLDRGTDPDESG